MTSPATTTADGHTEHWPCSRHGPTVPLPT
jgi:hypothetical protein